MIDKRINITKSAYEALHFLSNEEAKAVIQKGWTLSFVYSLIELRDVYLVIKKNGHKGITYRDFSNIYLRGKIPYYKKEWDEKGRRYLEIRNALINFGLLNAKSLEVVSDCFDEDTIPGSPLTLDDEMIFKQIYFSYFRFKEMSSLFINPEFDSSQRLQVTEEQIANQSVPIFTFISQKGYTDSFFYKLEQNPKLYILQASKENSKYIDGLKRFWDVFISWGTQLRLIEKFNMKNIGCVIDNNKTFTCNYFIKKNQDFNIENFIIDAYNNKRLLDIAELVWKLCYTYRISIADAQQRIIQYHIENPDKTSLLRTSEIFIKKAELSSTDKILYPKYKDSYVSHLKLRSHYE